jgi:cation/acetate symporter
MNIDPWILAFSAITVGVTIWMGFRSAKQSKTASDFFVAGRSVGVGMNASAISGEYLSAASFMGVAGMVMSSGYDALWYPVCYACGYLFLLLFIAGPLRRFGAYTIPDFAEGRFDSPLFRKIAVVFVLFIGFFYTMPQMKGAGTTLAYIFPGLPYWAGVVLVGAVITLNVALGGMKGITLVQAFQYWIKMFAISVPIFVLMAVYGGYGKQVGANGLGTQAVIESATYARTNIWYQGAQAARSPLPEKAPADATWLNPFGPLTTKAAKAAKPEVTYSGPLLINGFGSGFGSEFEHSLRMLFAKLSRGQDFIFDPEKAYSFPPTNRSAFELVLTSTMERQFSRRISEIRYSPELTNLFITWPSETRLIKAKDFPKEMHSVLESNGVTVLDEGKVVTAFLTKDAKITSINPKPYSLLYTYSLIIAIVCGTAGLPHILVRFYTNPDGVAAKRTTMWVMILIGVFYVFPPVFGVIGRNLLPELYSGVGAKGTDKIVLELPRIISERYGVLGSILSGISCAGAFAAFMSTFSGLLVSMTGALAHDVYGRMLNPKASAEQRMKMFKWCAVLIGGVAVVLGSFVEPLEINFMVGQAFAIAAASYFPLLFMAVWWRKLTMKGAATGMLTGGLSALIGISLTSFSTLASAPGKTGELFALFKPLNDFWAAHPLLRILCEQPAIWAVPLAIILMVIVSKLTSKDVPEDIRMKMLVLHAPEKLGLKQEYIQEHQAGAGH